MRGLSVFATSSGNIAATASCGGTSDGLDAMLSLISTAAPASSGISRHLDRVLWSYTTTPSSGRLKVFDGTSSGALLCDLDILAQVPDGIAFPPLKGTPGNKITVQLAQAGSSVIGRLNIYGWED